MSFLLDTDTCSAHHTKDFAHVPGLTLEDWLVP